MGELDRESVPGDDPWEPEPTGPLLRDPPPPPGYVDPIDQSDLLEDPSSFEGDA